MHFRIDVVLLTGNIYYILENGRFTAVFLFLKDIGMLLLLVGASIIINIHKWVKVV